MNEIFVARKAFAAVFTNSAVSRSGYQKRNLLLDEVAVDVACDFLGLPRTVRVDSEHNAIRTQGVLYRVSLPQELGVPRHLDGIPRGRQFARTSAQARGRSHGHRGFPEDHRGVCQQRGQRLDQGIDIRQVRGELALLLRRCHGDEMHVGEDCGLLV